MGAVFFGRFHCAGPHIIVLCIFCSLTARNGIRHEAYCSYHIIHIEYQSVVPPVPVRIFICDDIPLFFQVNDKLLFIPFFFRQQHKAHKGTFAFFLSPVLFHVIFNIVHRFVYQTADEFLEAVRQMCDLVIVLLIHMYHGRFPVRAAVPVVKEYHIMSGARAIADGYTYGRIFPFVDHEPAA